MCPGARSERIRRLCVTSVVWLACADAGAQPATPTPADADETAESDGAETARPIPSAADEAGEPGSPSQPPLRVLVQLHVTDDTDLREALQAHFAALPATLVTRRADDAPATTGARLRAGRKAAAELGAGAVFWIEAEPDAPWLVVMLDPETGRILAREVGQQPGSEGASGEASALIVANATDALIRGEPVVLVPATEEVPEATPMAKPPPPPPAPAPPPIPPPPPDDHARDAAPEPSRPLSLTAGYLVRFVGDALPHHGGVALELDYRPRPALRLHLVGLALPAATLGATPSFELGRRGAGVGGAYVLSLGALGLQLGGTLLLEALDRHTPGAEGFTAEPDDTRFTFGIEPTVAALLPLFPGGRLSLYLRLGAEIMLNNFKYISRSSEDRVVLAPRRVQPGILLGLSLRL